jgi:RimJ/RimL family protein N-acetyltransferase
MTSAGIRTVTMDDAELLLAWRNDDETRRLSRRVDQIAPDRHRAWLTAALEDPDRLLALFLIDDEPVASVRYDRRPPEAEVSIVVAPDRRGRGFATLALRAGETSMRQAWPHVEALVSIVHVANAPSRRLFERDGFQLDVRDGRWLTLRKKIAPPR